LSWAASAALLSTPISQEISMKVLQVTNLPIYLPADKAAIPFGDPLNDAAFTLASPSVVTVPGYVPANGDAISFSVPVGGGTLPAAITAGTVYYVVGATPAAGTFNVSATKGGAGINAAQASTGVVTAHLLSGEFYGVTLPFKPGNTVVVENNTGGALTLQGAPDSGQAAAGTNTYNPPAGPGTFVNLVTVAAGGAAEVVLAYDWLRVSTAATLILQQN
jgi:hypothetical protein